MSTPSTVKRSDRMPPVAGQRGPRVWRWLVVLVAVLVLHWIAAQWVERARDTFAPEQPVHVPVQVALLTPEKIERKPSEAPAAKPAPVQAKAAPSQPRPHALTASPPAAAPAAAAAAASKRAAEAVAQAASEAAASAAEAAAAASASEAAASHAASQSGAQPAASAAQSVTAPAAPGVKFSVPPSGELQYDTFYNGVRNQPGTIHWSSDGKTRYEMVVSVPLPFVGTFSYSSHGHIDAFGLAPDQYIEKRGHRAEDVSIFNRTSKQIVFTKTPASLPLSDGAQDRFSMVMQLASLVRGDPDIYKPGVTRQFFVVDNDSGENWPIETIGDETIRTAQGYVTARHFMRLPRHDGDRRRIDVWLAPSLGWLPARIMQTEPNGTEIELVWRGALTIPVNRDAGNSTDSGAATPAATPPADANAASNPAAPSAAAPGINPAVAPADSPAESPAENAPANPASGSTSGPAPSPTAPTPPQPTPDDATHSATNPAANPSGAASETTIRP
ncbi:DUF3108 domain-containing protein [Paraburkholderia sp. DHOC27]|uniref:DUF3108 domain-containing protein n=1 Tax=Paraburkholderia sp. DHOC27 TaxID=2303330 RepID=UPI000E3D714D|nr:DUF3108 domain-containing protein [Paraburkholderia sp. DHOC27]RFU47177.1 DUF3108 domain-containing protein [Paraburkholderia sp. DHOC27]